MIEETIADLSFPFLKKTKTVRVYIPAHEEGEELPAIYMTDGQNLFEEERCAFGCWHVREAIREEYARTGRAAVVVGIFNDDPKDRFRELTPASIGPVLYPNLLIRLLVKLSGGLQAEAFDDFLLQTVIPYVEEHFPVKSGRSSRAFCGSSSGGLFSFFTALRHPETYASAGVFSPAFLAYSEESLNRWVLSQSGGEMPFLYLYMGNGDEKEQEMSPAFQSAAAFLKEHLPEEKVRVVLTEKARHHEEAWEPVFRDFLHLFLSGC